MSVREINRQFEHWEGMPPPSLALARIGVRLGLPFPEAGGHAETFEGPSSLEELRAMGASLGIGSAPPWEKQ